MTYRSKPHEVTALQFTGYFDSVTAAIAFVADNDLTDCEVTAQGMSAPYALDVTTAWGLRTIEAGDYLYILGGTLHAESKQTFERYYE